MSNLKLYTFAIQQAFVSANADSTTAASWVEIPTTVDSTVQYTLTYGEILDTEGKLKLRYVKDQRVKIALKTRQYAFNILERITGSPVSSAQGIDTIYQGRVEEIAPPYVRLKLIQRARDQNNNNTNLTVYIFKARGDMPSVDMRETTAGDFTINFAAVWSSYDEAGNAIPEAYFRVDGGTHIDPFAPTDITGLLARYTSSALSSLSDAASISTWSDSQLTYNMTGTLTTRPTKQTVSTVPIARFDGANDFLINTTFLDTLPSAITLFAVVRWTNGAGSEKYLFSRDVGSSGLFAFTVHSDEKLRLVTSTNGATYKNVYSASALTQNTWYLVAGVWNGVTALKNYVNGVLATGDVSTTLADTAGDARMSIYIDGASVPFNGDVADFLVYNSALSNANLNNVANYLIALYPTLTLTWAGL